MRGLAATTAILALVATSSGRAAPSPIDHPDWVRLPDPAQMTCGIAPCAMGFALPAHATLACRVTPTGRLTRCAVIEEHPADDRIGAYALKLSRQFRMATSDGTPTAGRIVRVPIRFASGDEALRTAAP